MEHSSAGRARRPGPEILGAWLLTIGIGLATLSVRSEVATAASAEPLQLSPCHLTHFAEEVRCGTHEVFENRTARSGRRLKIHIAVLEPLRRTTEPDPLFIMAGGPGQGARSFGAVAARYFKKLRRTREIVLVDLRGTGDSHPLLCPPVNPFASRTPLLGDPGAAAACLAALDADPRHYTHADALADLDEIRQRLGYKRINLWGGSWGTRAALIYAATYPEAVRSVTLDGAVPLGMEFPASTAADSERAIDLLFARCEADADCARAFPGARADFARLLDRLSRRSEPVSVKHPQTAARVEFMMSRDFLAEAVRVALYTPVDASRILQILARAGAGDFAPLSAQVVRSAATSTDDMALGTTMSILCSEDLPRVANEDFAILARGTFVGASYAEDWRSRCRVWPAGVGLSLDPGLRLETPALILSGEHDPVTPPRWGEMMGRHFPNHLHVVVPGAAHNASFSGCVPDLIAQFVEGATGSGIDPSCAESVAWPPFTTSDAGTRP